MLFKQNNHMSGKLVYVWNYLGHREPTGSGNCEFSLIHIILILPM
jgi:hypothetical protein